LTKVIAIIATSLIMITSAFAADVDGNWAVMFSSAEGGSVVSIEIKIDGETTTAMASVMNLSGHIKTES